MVSTYRVLFEALIYTLSPLRGSDWGIADSSPSLFFNFTNIILLLQLDKIVGLAMLVAASVVFTYYTIWTLLMVSAPPSLLQPRCDPMAALNCPGYPCS
jgi:hypothetical protein